VALTADIEALVILFYATLEGVVGLATIIEHQVLGGAVTPEAA